MGDHEEDQPAGFALERHAMYLKAMASELPRHYATQEVLHLTLAYFAVASLSLLRALDRVNTDQIAKWILSFQVHPEANDDLDNGQFYGFCGSRSTQYPSNIAKDPCHNGSHLASTYSALATLKIVGYDVLNLDDSKVLLLSMKKLQQPDGSFMPTHIGAETDLRFVYCAAAICSMLNDWSGMDKEKAKEHILNCQSYDGGFGMVPGSESHGGGTFCAVAALYLMGFIQADLASNLRESAIDVQLLLEWCLQRQAVDGGFQGRRSKPSDTCYAFWIGGVLKIIGAYHLIDRAALREFLLTCQTYYGGFGKFPGDIFPDIYHSYYGLAAVSLLDEEGVDPLCTELGIIAAAL